MMIKSVSAINKQEVCSAHTVFESKLIAMEFSSNISNDALFRGRITVDLAVSIVECLTTLLESGVDLSD